MGNGNNSNSNSRGSHNPATAATGGASPTPPNNNKNGKKEDTVKSHKDNLEPGDKIDLGKFNRPQKTGGKPDFVDPKSGWRISPDRAGNNSHGGSAWKLINKEGKRIATLDKTGKVLRK